MSRTATLKNSCTWATSCAALLSGLTVAFRCLYLFIHRRLPMSKTATLTVQQWGNSLAVRIPAAVARTARFRVGQPVEVSAQDSNVLVRSIGEPKLTLEQKLAVFDPALHGGEVMTTRPIGNEAI